ncbi:GNAT family N-acetyltransferase [Sporosarcina sp. E16_8]|uniref:GNAT family N-acetyltransferase n=1 Tax=Sporosarcina sp. E16_8 TaxID=2789295 RepID=UPI001A9111EF|nr:GNAT family N-acetyltransferase [Sporosarcina sp. E16_8]MBO0586898.1 GNAT family N-acetyltransferase [Sporosarcina sp. E16_8]
MGYKFEYMTQEHAEEIAFNWHYDAEYSFYNMEEDKEDLAEFLDDQKRGDSNFFVTKDNDAIGFFSFNRVAINTIDIGLGIKPNLTGNGNGLELLKAGLDFAKIKYKPRKITLSVATFNQRAIKVYRKIGFEDVETFMQDTNGNRFEFLKMTFQCQQGESLCD